MKKNLLTLLVLICFATALSAQRENSRWYMGYNTGMDFMQLNTIQGVVNGVANQAIPAVPTALKGPIMTAEGCFSISDRDGNFMFASDGMTVYNGPLTTNVMKNGTDLTGHPSSTQSGVIIPRPSHKDQFYIIASDYQAGLKGITYSIVDWSVTNANGRGEIVAGKKNIPLNFGGVYNMTTSYEGVAAYPHANGQDFWIVNRTRGYFFVWLATKDGINPAPVAKYSIGVDPGDAKSTGSGLGFVKFSMDGKYIAQTCWNGSMGGVQNSDIFIAKFNNKTGVIDLSSLVKKNLGFLNCGWLFGIEFSPDNKYLYFTTLFHNNASGDLWRIPMTEPLSINWHLVQEKSIAIGNIGLGPDNKLYGVGGTPNATGMTYNGRHLYIIPNPDDVTLDKYLINDYFPVGTRQGYSLPNFVYSFFGANLKGNLNPCINHSATYDIQISAGTGPNAVSKLVWDFGDGTPQIIITNMDQLVYTQTHKFANTGKHTITVTPYKVDGSIFTDKIQRLSVMVSNCVVPVNPNIHLYNKN